ncbi:hypothetical protein GF312_03680 [Candidatus Poribacteria bacterium]|nr:hypothetical protein [Candidatus Poribacteria bacterium]
MKKGSPRQESLIKKIMNTMDFDKGIQAIARKLSFGDPFTAEELRNEMHIALLNMEPGREDAYYYRAAKNKAIDYLKSKAVNYSYCNLVKHISYESMESSGFQLDTEGNIYEPKNHSPLDIGEIDNDD